MAHPKKRSSTSRRDKRRTHIKLAMPALVICPVTGVAHRSHHAFWHEDTMYYKGRVVMHRTETQ